MVPGDIYRYLLGYKRSKYWTEYTQKPKTSKLASFINCQGVIESRRKSTHSTLTNEGNSVGHRFLLWQSM